LKLLNIFDPYVGEFFFGGHNIIVEGDTEYSAFNYIISKEQDSYKDVHIIRARGKATIVSLIKILNHFGSSYSVLHDTDCEFISNGNKNSAWTLNQKILDEINKKPENSKIRLVASKGNFEQAYLGEEIKKDKPYNAIINLQESDETYKNIKELFDALIDHTKKLPDNAIEWKDINDLIKYLNN
jgi:putative ATP-dependent endonuclease of OLD family